MKLKVYFTCVFVGLSLTAVILSAQAQQTGQTGAGTSTSGTTGAAGGNGTNPGAPGNSGNTSLDRGNSGRINTNPNNRSLPSNRQQQILTITGSVVLEDGTPPPMGAIIERECGGRKTRETSVSPNGTFGFQIGGSSMSDVLPDASDNTPMQSWVSNRSSMGFPDGMNNPALAITGCELRAQLGGYRSSSILLTSNQTMGIMDAGTIVLYPASRVKGSTVSVTSLAAPKEARRALEKAEKAFQKKNLDEAEKDAKAALQVYPVFAAAWFQLGEVYARTDRIEDAKSAYAKAMDADANYVSPYIELARFAGSEAKWEETVRLTDRALDLDPLDYPYGYFMNALANYNLGHFEEAEKSARKLNQLDPLHRWPQIHLVLAGILHRKHDYQAEMAQLRAYLKYAPQSADADAVRSRLSSMEKGSNN